MQGSPLGPPDHLFGNAARLREEGFAVGDVAACDDAEPESPGHLLAGEVSPAAVQVSLVHGLVKNDWLTPLGEPLRSLGELVGLQAGVRNERASVVVHVLRVVDGTEMLVGVDLLRQAEEPGEVGGGLGLHQVELVGQRPPDVGEGCESRHEVVEIPVIRLGGHGGKAPPIIGVKQNEISLDVEIAKLAEALLQVRPVGGVEARDVAGLRQCGSGWADEGVKHRLVVVVLVGLGEQAHANFVEWRDLERRERLLL